MLLLTPVPLSELAFYFALSSFCKSGGVAESTHVPQLGACPRAKADFRTQESPLFVTSPII
jgi:hypothetical protein